MNQTDGFFTEVAFQNDLLEIPIAVQTGQCIAHCNDFLAVTDGGLNLLNLVLDTHLITAISVD